MKKFLISLLCVLAALLCICCNAGTYTPPENNPDKPATPVGPTKPDLPPEEQITFTVRLENDGKQYIPTQAMTAVFMGMSGMYTADFDLTTGVAEIKGLDGEYHVILQNLPDNLSYDNNAYQVSNDHPDLTIVLDTIIATYDGVVVDNPKVEFSSQSGKFVTIEQLGTYRTILSGKDSMFLCAYRPTASGFYTVSSRMDITANEVNPKVDLYIGQAGFIAYYERTQDGGGLSSTYTKNFLMEIELTDDELNNALMFAVYAENRGNTYPIEIDFTIERLGEAGSHSTAYTLMDADGPFATEDAINADRQGKSFTFFSVENPLLDSTRVKFNPSDGFYHMVNADGSLGGYVYCVFNQDFKGLSTNTGNGFLDGEARGQTRFVNKEGSFNYYNFVGIYGGDVNGIDENGSPIIMAEEDIHSFGGMHPVNEEIYYFLAGYADSEGLFMDGDGYAEMNGVKSDEKSMWLFACGYYK